MCCWGVAQADISPGWFQSLIRAYSGSAATVRPGRTCFSETWGAIGWTKSASNAGAWSDFFVIQGIGGLAFLHPINTSLGKCCIGKCNYFF